MFARDYLRATPNQFISRMPYAHMLSQFFLTTSTLLFWGMYFRPSGRMKEAITEWHSMDAGLCLTFAGITQQRSGPQVIQPHTSLAALLKGKGDEPL